MKDLQNKAICLNKIDNLSDSLKSQLMSRETKNTPFQKVINKTVERCFLIFSPVITYTFW